MDPAIGNGRLAHLVLLRQPQPAKQEAAPLTVSGGLRCIELKAPVQLVKSPVREVRPVEISRQPAALVEVAVILPLRCYALRATYQHVAIPQGEQIRALPHIAKLPQTA
ncbi:hypothetical protein D3C87_1769560 [compost metagenome]